MKIAEFAKNLRERNSDIDKMLLVCLMLNFGDQDITEVKKKYGEIVVIEFEKYLE